MDDGGMSCVVSRKWLRVVLAIGGILAGWNFLRWEIIEFQPIFLFLQFFIEAGLWLLFLAAALSSMAYYAIKAYKAGWAAGKYAVIILISAMVVIFFPYNDVVLGADFRYYLADREKVVAMVKTGDPALNPEPVRQFKDISLQWVKLPSEYRHLSKGGGEIVVQRKGESIKIFFYTFRGILDNF